MASPGPTTRDEVLARIEEFPLGQGPGEMRENFRHLVLGTAAGPDDATRCFRPETGGGDLLPIVWFHGGGYVFGGPDTHAGIARYLSDAHGFVVYLPHYPLAPDHQWPAQLEAALASIPQGPAPILAGDSAGGHLALVTALALAREGTPAAGLLLFSPNTDRSGLSETRKVMDDDDPVVTDAGDAYLAKLCFGDRSASDPQVSPLLDDLSLLPPTWIEVGTPEVLLDDSRMLAARGKEVGADIHLTVTEGLLHMAQVWAPGWAEARDSLDRAAVFAASLGSDDPD